MSGHKANIRPLGEEWFRINRPKLAGEHICSSKYYKDQDAWWIDIPKWLVERGEGYVNLLCEIDGTLGGDFYHLRVSLSHLQKKCVLGLVDLRKKGDTRIYSLHLSLSSDNRFWNKRGKGRLDFSEFLYSPDGNKN